MAGGGADRIEVRGLRAEGVHGVLPEEQTRPQPFEVDLDLYLDLAPAVSSDDLGDSADYAAAVDAALAVIAGPPRRLLETLAAAIATRVLEDPAVDQVTVTVRKLRPPVTAPVDSTGVRLHRRRDPAPSSPGPGAAPRPG